MTLFEKHIARVEAVNNSTNDGEHFLAEHILRAWRRGVEDAGLTLDLCAVDLHYLDQGIDRPMCCGVFLDWEPTPTLLPR